MLMIQCLISYKLKHNCYILLMQLALQSMAKEQVDEMSLRQAKSLEAKERFKEAEKFIYTAIL